jgi:hypothetical protein
MTHAALYRRLERAFLVRGVALLLPAALVPVAGCATDRAAGSSGSCCSEAEWTTTVDVAKAYAGKDAPTVHGCPASLADPEVDKAVARSEGRPPPPPWGTRDLLEGPTSKLRAKGEPGCVYKTVSCCPGGRPLYAEGERRAVVASRKDGARWTRKALAPLGLGLAPELRAAVANAWLDDALAEHASVASFARATLELVAVGAPPALLAAHQRAGLQEIRHAERCFALARAYGERAIDPGPVAIPLPRAGGLVRLACDTFVEGCVAETIGALLAARALEVCTIAEPREVLRRIEADEAAHAALAWRTLAWALREGGEAVTRAVLERARTLREEAGAGESDPSLDLAELHAHGRLGEGDVRATTDDAWRTLIEPLLAKLSRAA